MINTEKNTSVFLKAIKKVGNILKRDAECRAFLEKSTKEIDTYKEFFE